MMYSALGVLCLVSALIDPFVLYLCIKKTINKQVPYVECGLLSLGSLVFILWLISVFSNLST